MCSNDDEVPLSLQTIPQEFRIRLFENYITSDDLQTLRGVSKLFKYEIDQEVGLKKNVEISVYFGEAATHSLCSVALQAVTLELHSKMLLDIRNVLTRPSKLRHCVIGGRIRREMLHSLLSSASNLSSWRVTGILLPPSTTSCSISEVPPQPDEEEASRHFLQRLKSLEVSLRQTSPGMALQVMMTSQEVLRSISAPKLSKFDLKIDFDLCTAIQIFRTIVDFITFKSDFLAIVDTRFKKADGANLYTEKDIRAKITRVLANFHYTFKDDGSRSLSPKYTSGSSNVSFQGSQSSDAGFVSTLNSQSPSSCTLGSQSSSSPSANFSLQLNDSDSQFINDSESQ